MQVVRPSPGVGRAGDVLSNGSGNLGKRDKVARPRRWKVLSRMREQISRDQVKDALGLIKG